MKKIVTFVLAILLGGFLTNTGRAKARDIKAAVIAPDKNGALSKEAIIAKTASLTVPFVKNVGQFNVEVKYAADLFAGRFFLTDKELVYSLRQRGKAKTAQPGKHEMNVKAKREITPGKGIVFREYFIDQKGAKIILKSSGEQKAETIVSYFKDNDAGKWRSGIASYQSVSLGQVYPGIEVKLKASGRNVEKVFYINPKSSVDAIKIGVEGISGLKIDQDGRLLLKNTLGELAMRAPVACQEIAGKRHGIKVGYRLLGKHLYGFAVIEDYDMNLPLIIDPDLDTLMASTYLGGNGFERTYSLALDRSGNVYVTGYTSSTDFPTTTGSYDRTYNGGYADYDYGDVFISKLDSSLKTLLASTFLGGGGWDSGKSLALDSSGNVYLTGYTRSKDFPTTAGAFDRTFNGGYGDVFVSKLNGDLTELLASTYLGGSIGAEEFGGNDIVNYLALDRLSNVYVTGETRSSDFPTTAEAYDRSFNSDDDLFVSKLNNSLTTLLASTFLGGNDSDDGYSLALDSFGNVYVTGGTFSFDFPTTVGAYQRVGYADAFVSKLDGNLTTLLASTGLGGSDNESGSSLVLDSSGNVYVTGYTGSGDFPTTEGAYCRENSSPRSGSGDYFYLEDVFVSKFSNDLTKLLASTYLGGFNVENGNSLALDSSGNVYVTGGTDSRDFPTTEGAYDRTYNLGSAYGKYYYSNAFVSKLDGNLTSLQASTYLGDGYSQSSSLALDSSGSVYLTGCTNSKDFPTTAGAYDRNHNGNNDNLDAFVAKLHVNRAINVTSPNGSEIWMVGTTQNITWKTIGKTAKVKIEVSTNRGSTWSDVITATANDGNYPWIIPNTPSRQCLVRISDAANTAIKDTSDKVFSILMNLDLQAERREARAFSILRQYGQIRFLVGTGNEAAAQYKIMRRQGSGDFILLRAIEPSELQNNQFQMQDKYLEKDIPYTYRVEAYDGFGQLIGISLEKTI